jgi:hypothetical protein
MWRLAKGVQDLDTTLGGEVELNEVDRQTRILAILDDMAAATSAVSAPGQSTNHKNIELHIDRLQLEIALARRSAETNDYTAAKEAMFLHTDTEDAPWIVIKSDCKKRARLNVIAHILSQIPYKTVDRAKVKLPSRSSKRAYDDQSSIADRRYEAEKF